MQWQRLDNVNPPIGEVCLILYNAIQGDCVEFFRRFKDDFGNDLIEIHETYEAIEHSPEEAYEYTYEQIKEMYPDALWCLFKKPFE